MTVRDVALVHGAFAGVDELRPQPDGFLLLTAKGAR
jgi:hypothetical protein